MKKIVWISLICSIAFLPLPAVAESFLSSGSVNLSSGVPDRDLRYEDFRITEDGFIEGYIVNTSARNRPALTLDMWTTNMSETRIFWRKRLNIGDLGPKSRFLVREPYDVKGEDPQKTKFMFRLPSSANYRNK